MKRYPKWRRTLTLLSCAFLLSSLGCSDPEELTNQEEVISLECGTGTTLVDGECIIADFGCAEGQVFTPGGQCRTPDIFCGSDTVYDAGIDGCISATAVECGAGTVEANGRCVVEDAKSCGTGTVLAEGTCRISSDICGPGTSLDESSCVVSSGACAANTQFDVVTGECTDPGMVECGEGTVQSAGNRCVPLTSFADQLAAEADFDASDSDRTITLGAVGDQVIFTGTMNNQSNLFQVFPVAGEEGKWIQVTLYSRGAPSLGFRLRQTFGSWERRVLPGYYSSPSRKVALPGDGNYDLIIENSLSTASGGPFGDASWSYVGVVEVVEAPESSTWDFLNEPLSGNLATIEDNLFEIDLPSDAQTLFLTDFLGSNAQLPRVEVWASPTEYLTTFALNTEDLITVDPGEISGPVYLLFDAREFTGPTTAFEVSAQGTTTLLPGGFASDTFEAQEGDILRIRHRNAGGTNMDAQIAFDGDIVWNENDLIADNRTTFIPIDEIKGGFYYVPTTGTYVIEHLNQGSSAIEGFFSTSRVETVPQFQGEEVESYEVFIPADGLVRGDWRFAVIHSPSAARIEGSSTVGSGRSDVSIYNLDGDRLENFANIGTSQEFQFTIRNPGTYILAMRARDSINGGINLEFEYEPLESLPTGEVLTETFTAQTFDVLRFNVEYAEGSGPDMTLRNPDGVIVREELALSSGRELFLLIPGSGEYTLEVANNGMEATVGLDYSFVIFSPDPVLSIGGDFTESLTLSTPLEEGERHYVLFRSLTDLAIQLQTTIGEEEEAKLRLIGFDSNLTLESEGTEEISIISSRFTTGTYILEIEALTDLDNGFSLEIEGSQINVAIGTKTYPSAITVPMEADYISTVQITGCDTILETEILIQYEEFWNNWVNVYITPPNGDELHLWANSSFGTDDEMNFPEDDTPADDLDELIGQNGNGTWTLRLRGRQNSSNFDALLTNWMVTLICAS